jgi:hypothetical protein
MLVVNRCSVVNLCCSSESGSNSTARFSSAMASSVRPEILFMCQKFRPLVEPLVSTLSDCWIYFVYIGLPTEAGKRAEGLFLSKIFMTASNTRALGKRVGERLSG